MTTSNSAATLSLKERLILAGIDEIRKVGIHAFSLRNIASKCHVSPAAPYKHFESKQDFIIAIIEYINNQWDEQIARVVLQDNSNNYRKQLVDISVAYIRFLVENPHFRSIIMLKDEGLTPEQIRLKSKLSDGTAAVIDRYCESVGMSEERRKIKTFIVRSLIYGAALMMDNGELEYTEENISEIVKTIEREFDLI